MGTTIVTNASLANIVEIVERLQRNDKVVLYMKVGGKVCETGTKVTPKLRIVLDARDPDQVCVRLKGRETWIETGKQEYDAVLLVSPKEE